MHKSADDGGQRAFHSGYGYHYAGALEGGELNQQSVEAGDADVEYALYLAAHDFGGYHGFAGDGQVGGAGADYHYAGGLLALVRRAAVDDDAARHLFVAGVGYVCGDGVVGGLGRAGYEQAVGALQQGVGYGRYLLRGFALPEYDLRETLAKGAVVVDFGEVEVFERQVY